MPAAEHEVTLEALELDPERVVGEIADAVRDAVLRRLRRRGAIVAVSGGVDSAVAAALCVRALGPERVVALPMPEQESDPTLSSSAGPSRTPSESRFSSRTSRRSSTRGCYRRRDDAIRSVIPEYGPGYKAKIVLPSVIDGDSYRLSPSWWRHRTGRRPSTA